MKIKDLRMRWFCFSLYRRTLNETGPFLEAPEKVSHPESHGCKISNLMITELFYSHVLNMNRGSLHARSFRLIYLSVFRYKLSKNDSAGPERFRGFRETVGDVFHFHIHLSDCFSLVLAVQTFLFLLWKNVNVSFNGLKLWRVPVHRENYNESNPLYPVSVKSGGMQHLWLGLNEVFRFLYIHKTGDFVDYSYRLSFRCSCILEDIVILVTHSGLNE